jgi:hypothetical protein
MILRDCETCGRRTPQTRRQWVETENGHVVIYTEWTCTSCTSTDTNCQPYATNE